MGDERRINQLTTKAYDNIGSSDYFAVDNASEAESKKLPASSIKTPISNLQGEVTGGSDTYSSTKNYSVGMYATHTTGGVQKLYRCKTACTAASWTTNASCFEEANLADAVSALNNDLNMKTYLDNSSEVTITSAGVFDFIAIRIGRLLYIRGTFQHSNNIVKIKISDVKFNKTTNHSNNIANNKFMTYTSGAQNMSRLILTTAISNDQHEVTWSGITSSYPFLIVDNVFILDN